MTFGFSVDPNVVAAWWGAIVATFLAAFELFKYLRSGPRLHLEASGDLYFVSSVPTRISNGKEKYVSVRVTNRGDRGTTLTNFVGVSYSSGFKRWVRRGARYFVVPTGPPPLFSKQLPAMLGPGEVWQGHIRQNEIERDFGPRPVLLVGVSFGHGKTPLMGRVVWRKAKDGDGHAGEDD